MLVTDAQTIFSQAGRGGSDVWYTPQWILERLLVLKQGTWRDPFPQGWDGAWDGFTMPWSGNLYWVNPPYSRLSLAVAKGLTEVERRPRQLQLWLLASRTETRAYQQLLVYSLTYHCPLLFFSGRLLFTRANGTQGRATFPSTLFAIAGAQVPPVYRERFVRAFGQYGRILSVIH